MNRRPAPGECQSVREVDAALGHARDTYQWAKENVGGSEPNHALRAKYIELADAYLDRRNELAFAEVVRGVQ